MEVSLSTGAGSAIVPHAVSWLLNPEHPDSGKIAIVEVARAPFDPRLVGAK